MMSKEKTAIQQLIEYDDRLISNGRDSVSADLILNLLRKKMVELRDTVEKEQRRNLYVNGFHDGQSSHEMLIDDEVVQKYNEKYGSDEIQT